MHSSQTCSVRRILAWSHFHHVSSLLKQKGNPDALILSESSVEGVEPLAERFVAVVSSGFSALLQGNSMAASLDAPCQIQLTFDPCAIAAFLSTLKPQVPMHSLLERQITHAIAQLAPNDPYRQSEFTLQLLETLSPTAHCLQPATMAQPLQQQIQQERLLNQVTSLIRQSLELPVVLETAVQQVRQFLQTDRLIIYQLNIPAPSCLVSTEPKIPAQETIPTLDGITYESRKSDAIPSVLHFIKDDTDIASHALWSADRDRLTWAIADCQIVPSQTRRLLKLSSQAQVQAELVTPIIVEEQLWGLLIAHQCYAPRQWQDHEQAFLHHIAEHLAIAIRQSNLYSELHAQKLTLEQKVAERTQALRDTLVAAQSASLAKSEFLATMSHELRSPLTSIIGMAATLLRAYSSEMQPAITVHKQQKYLQTIQNRGEHLLSLINDILDLSQVEAGKLGLIIEQFSLVQLARQTVEAVQPRANAKQVNLCLDVQQGQGDMQFYADPQRVQQILFNLLTNAIKFTPAQGQVMLRVWAHDQAAILQVEDNGIGISEEQRSLLFQTFQQLDCSYDRKYEGTGLGLALTKQLVELHGGSIDVKSTIGIGSIFTVHLPEQEASKPS
ncbi:GAF domain-containing sensor histidine kinase [Myxacorys almedinensis]|uniref:histidine kinase n=1 Tax=Myxacorys almedinensis A TaxID=2690445 RepID=A0A8J7Z3D7_9CYAN|nr:GAF domain-containing sensor histidine kinase [Myxacorys almedinensis]NDJ17096.1 GAF domain-containing protein [Myxacorys almedinensis A]